MAWLTNPWVVGFLVFGFIIAQMVTFWQAPKPKLPDSYLARREKEQAMREAMEAQAAERRALFEQQRAKQQKMADSIDHKDINSSR